MKIISLLVSCFLGVGCAQQVANPAHPALTPGEHYGPARARLISAGWSPVPAMCSEQNLCFRDYSELSTQLATAVTCGRFQSGPSFLTVCAEPIADGLLVASIRDGR
jgi:hypothetical protein